jgi:hypothetical protein
LRSLPHGSACPGEVDQHIAPPAVTESLRCVKRLEPADHDEVFSGSFDVPEVHTKDVGNPGGLTPPAADATVIAVVEAAHEVPQHRGNNRGAAALGNETDGLPWHGYAPTIVGYGVRHDVQVREVVDTP